MSQDFTIQFQRIKNAYFTLPVMGDFPKFSQHKLADFSSIFQRFFPDYTAVLLYPNLFCRGIFLMRFS